MADPPIRIGLLGAARIAPMAIIEPARGRDDVTIVSVAARDPARAMAFAQEHGLEGGSESYAALIARADIDLVYIALPPDAHAKWAIAALEAGRAVLCEKPFALNVKEARAMVDAADRTGRPLIEAFHYRFHQLMCKAIELMRDGAIGTPLRAEAEVHYPIPRRPNEPRWSAEHGGGALLDLGCYGIHALRTLLAADPDIVAASVRSEQGVDVETSAELRFGAVDARLACSMDPPEPRTNIVIEGTAGRIEIRGFVLPQRAGNLRLVRGGRGENLPIDGPTSYAAQLDHVVELLHGRAAPVTGGADAIATMAAIDAIRRLAVV